MLWTERDQEQGSRHGANGVQDQLRSDFSSSPLFFLPTAFSHTTVPFLTLIQSVSHPWRTLPLGVFPLLPQLQESFSSHLPHMLQVSPYGAGFLLLLHVFFEYLWMLSFNPDQAVGWQSYIPIADMHYFSVAIMLEMRTLPFLFY